MKKYGLLIMSLAISLGNLKYVSARRKARRGYELLIRRNNNLRKKKKPQLKKQLVANFKSVLKDTSYGLKRYTLYIAMLTILYATTLGAHMLCAGLVHYLKLLSWKEYSYATPAILAHLVLTWILFHFFLWKKACEAIDTGKIKQKMKKATKPTLVLWIPLFLLCALSSIMWNRKRVKDKIMSLEEAINRHSIYIYKEWLRVIMHDNNSVASYNNFSITYTDQGIILHANTQDVESIKNKLIEAQKNSKLEDISCHACREQTHPKNILRIDHVGYYRDNNNDPKYRLSCMEMKNGYCNTCLTSSQGQRESLWSKAGICMHCRWESPYSDDKTYQVGDRFLTFEIFNKLLNGMPSFSLDKFKL